MCSLMLSSRVLCSDYDRVFSFRLKIDAFSGNLLNYLADSHILTFFSLSLSASAFDAIVLPICNIPVQWQINL